MAFEEEIAGLKIRKEEDASCLSCGNTLKPTNTDSGFHTGFAQRPWYLKNITLLTAYHLR